jgi:hypothetical protein
MAAQAEVAQEALRDAPRRLSKTDPDPHVGQRAQAVSLVEHGQTLAGAGRLLAMKPDRERIWQRTHLVATAFGAEALEGASQTDGLPLTTGRGPNLPALLLRERRLRVCPWAAGRARLGLPLASSAPPLAPP